MALRLVGDVGGTSSRLGLSDGGVLQEQTIRSFRNDDFPGFEQLAETYLQQGNGPAFSDIVLAIAGPTSGQSGRLTNREWVFETSALSARFGNRPVALLNDLWALGLALPHLREAQIDTVGDMTSPPNGQSLIIGIGTGFNVCPVRSTDTGVICLEAEYGHSHLSAKLDNALRSVLGDGAADGFDTVEEVFSGRGFRALEQVFEGRPNATGNDTGFRSFYLGLLAQLVGDLCLAYLPHDGIFFAGGMARVLLREEDRHEFIELYAQESTRKFKITAPVHLLSDDHAALYGCARY